MNRKKRMSQIITENQRIQFIMCYVLDPVVVVPAFAEHIDDDIFAESLLEQHCAVEQYCAAKLMNRRKYKKEHSNLDAPISHIVGL